MQAVDYYLTYRFLKNLVLPYERWDAYKTGVIDEHGNILVAKEERTAVQKASFGSFENLTMNLKDLIRHLPGGKTKIASYAAAMFLLREKDRLNEMTESEIEKAFAEALAYVEEDVVANNVGSGHIAGAGVGPKGEPPVRRKRTARDLIRRTNTALVGVQR